MHRLRGPIPDRPPDPTGSRRARKTDDELDDTDDGEEYSPLGMITVLEETGAADADHEHEIASGPRSAIRLWVSSRYRLVPGHPWVRAFMCVRAAPHPTMVR